MMVYNVFISYSRKDKSFIDKFCKSLTDCGITYWLDKRGIENGNDFKTTIVKAIESSSVFLFFSSKNSNNSIWTAKEIGIAVARSKPIIPIKLDSSPYNEAVEFDLVNLDFVDFSRHSTYNETLSKLIDTIAVKCSIEVNKKLSKTQEHKYPKVVGTILFLLALLAGLFFVYNDRSESGVVTVLHNNAELDDDFSQANILYENESRMLFTNESGDVCYDSISPYNLNKAKMLYENCLAYKDFASHDVCKRKYDSLMFLVERTVEYCQKEYELSCLYGVKAREEFLKRKLDTFNTVMPKINGKNN